MENSIVSKEKYLSNCIDDLVHTRFRKDGEAPRRTLRLEAQFLVENMSQTSQQMRTPSANMVIRCTGKTQTLLRVDLFGHRSLRTFALSRRLSNTLVTRNRSRNFIISLVFCYPVIRSAFPMVIEVPSIPKFLVYTVAFKSSQSLIVFRIFLR